MTLSLYKSVLRSAALVTLLVVTLLGSLPVSSVHAESLSKPSYLGGDYVWAKDIGDGMSSVYQSTIDLEGNLYIIGGYDSLDSSAYIAKLDKRGNFVWSKKLNGGQNTGIFPHGIALDANNNVYVSGGFLGTVDFDPGDGEFSLTSTNINRDIFILKLDQDGNFVWARAMGWIPFDDSYGFTVDTDGNSYATGIFRGIVDFDPGPGIFNLTSVSASYVDVFILKLDGNGDFVWAKAMGGTRDDFGRDIVLDANNNLYVTGDFMNTVDFDPGENVLELTSQGWEDAFVAKLDSTGNLIWAKAMGGPDIEKGEALAVDLDGNVYTTGFFDGTTDFDPGPDVYNLVTQSNEDCFASKLDVNGDFVWAKAVGGWGEQYTHGIALDTLNNAYIVGEYEGTVDFDPGPGTYKLGSSGLNDAFILNLDKDGNFVWAKNVNGEGRDVGFDVAVDAWNNVYAFGYFEATADFDPGPGTSYITSTRWLDGFILKLETNDTFFADVPATYWANQYIDRLYFAGVTGGCGTAPLVYCPEEEVTRAQLAVFLLRAEHGKAFTPPAATGAVFGDVAADYWAAPWIEALSSEGITSGCGEGNYCPDAVVTRDQMAVFLLRAKNGSTYAPPVATGLFADVPADYWSAAWIEALASEGITGGCGNGNYCPTTAVTRDQMAVFLVKAFNLP